MRNSIGIGIGIVAWLACTTASAPAFARTPEPPSSSEDQTFALIVGVNRPQEQNLAPLRFADDDAFKYESLFRALGAQTVTLTEPDENSRRLYAESAAVKPPTRSEFVRATDRLKTLVAEAHAQKKTATVYFVYAGHGARDKKTSEGYLTLSDARLNAAELFFNIVDKTKADTFHFVVDACNSQFLTEARGPGGKRRQLLPLSHDLARQALDHRVGMLFATSSMTKTFEYEGFQAGVFSHLVRSGLYGAADFDLDGMVSYEELQRFVALAASPIANELYRPRVQALPPAHTKTLADLRQALVHRIVIDGSEPAAHHIVESANGVRLIDFHNDAHQSIHLFWPGEDNPIYFSSEDGSNEVSLVRATERIVLSQAAKQPRRTAARGAADHAFRSLFTVPFSQARLAQIDLTEQAVSTDNGKVEELKPPRTKALAKVAFWTASALAVASAGTYGIAVLTHNSIDDTTTGTRTAELNQRTHSLKWAAAIGGGLAAGIALTGWVFLALPLADDNAQLDGGSLAFLGRW